MIKEEIEKILLNIPTFKERNYWLVRTQGGQYYGDYRSNDFIAIGHNEISLNDINESKKNTKNPYELLTAKIKGNNKEQLRPKYIATQLFKFAYEINKGDIVIIPGDNSAQISFGEIIETPMFLEDNIDYSNHKKCNYIKRKKVKWLKDIYRDELEPKLYKLLFSHHTITKANQYSSEIDRTINDFYIKEDEAHVILKVAAFDEIKARSLFQMGNNLLDIVDQYCKDNNLDIDTSEVEIKLNLQSPGTIQLSGKQKTAIAIIGLLIVGVVGGGFKIQYGDFEFDLSTKGAIQKVIDAQEANNDINIKNNILEKHVETFQIKQPNDLVNVLKQNSTNKTK
jgi:restriction system protein